MLFQTSSRLFKFTSTVSLSAGGRSRGRVRVFVDRTAGSGSACLGRWRPCG